MAAIPRFGTRVVPERHQIIDECRRRGQFVQGPHVEAFEQAFAQFLGSGQVRTREALKDYDPDLYALVHETMAYEGKTDWRFAPLGR